MAMDVCTLHFTAMASACEIHLAGAQPYVLEAAAERAIAEVRRIESKYSRYREDSVVSRINAAAGSGHDVEVDAETASLLEFAGQLHALSGGRFDITSGVLRRAWNFRAGKPPAPAQVEALLPLVGWDQVRRDARSIGLPRSGMELDFGGFGKEYAADRAATLLMDAGLCHGYVNLGGDIRIVGPREDGTAWRFGIQHPRDEHATIAGVELATGALATSGDYERFFIHEGVRYCHVLDPRTGWPVSAPGRSEALTPRSAQREGCLMSAPGRSEALTPRSAQREGCPTSAWQSISVALPACVAAGALTTIAMLQGDAALTFLAAQQAAYLAVDAQGQVFHSGL